MPIVDAEPELRRPWPEPPLRPATDVDERSTDDLEALVARGIRRAIDEHRPLDALLRSRGCDAQVCQAEAARLADQSTALSWALPLEVRPSLEATTLGSRATRFLEAGHRHDALAAALQCIDQFPMEPQCHRVVIAGLDGHERAERSREDLAWILLRARRATGVSPVGSAP
ncbi:MAG: hypothetical protein SFW67_19085 [Myxococcaceae bacterium]|nr:hypothetical protein [Myxococcaceae bacterium]